MIDLDRLLQLEKSATPSGWQTFREELPLSQLGKDTACDRSHFVETSIHTTWDHGQLKGPAPVVSTGTSPYCLPNVRIMISERDADLIVALRNAAPALLEALVLAREAGGLLEEAREFISHNPECRYGSGDPPYPKCTCGLDGCKLEERMRAAIDKLAALLGK